MAHSLIYPFTAFNFSVEIYPASKGDPLVSAAFSECDGLEMTMDVKTIRAGGSNDRAIRVAGVINYANLTLKRGMTDNFDLWKWFQRTITNPSLRADAQVVMLGGNAGQEQARFYLHRCLPIKLKAPALNAKDGGIAIEEFQMAYEKFEMAGLGA
ncbi:MAG: hypothetical protein RL367_232 [Pseudomonadota bacterium]